MLSRSADRLQRGLPHQAGPAQKSESHFQPFMACSMLVILQAKKKGRNESLGMRLCLLDIAT